MKKRIVILFMLLASVVMFLPEQSYARANEKSSVSTFSSAGNTVQYYYRRRYRRRYYRPRYRYRTYRRVRRTRSHYFYRNGRLYRVRY